MIDEFLNRRVTVQRAPQPVAADDGSASRVYANVATAVPFAIWPQSGSFRQTEHGLDRAQTHKGATYYAVQIGDRVVDGADTWEVTFLSRPQNAFYQCDLGRVAIP